MSGDTQVFLENGDNSPYILIILSTQSLYSRLMKWVPNNQGIPGITATQLSILAGHRVQIVSTEISSGVENDSELVTGYKYNQGGFRRHSQFSMNF